MNQSKILYDPCPRIMQIKTKVKRWDLIKLKCFYTAKETISKWKIQPSEWEKNNSKWNNWQRINFQNIQAAHTTRKTYNPIKKWEKALNRHFSKKHIQISNKHMRRCSTSFIIRGMQIKTTIRYHLTPLRMAIFKKSTNNKCWEGHGEKGTLLHCWWACKSIQPLWKTVWRYLKITRNKTTIWSSNPTPRHIPWGNQGWKRHIYSIVHCSTIYNS